jgi:hypothetical protein
MAGKKTSRRTAPRKGSTGNYSELIGLAIAAAVSVVGHLAKPHLDRWLRQLDVLFLGETDQTSSKDSSNAHARSYAFNETAKLEWHEILGVSKDATDAEVRAAHRSKIQHYHPDKVSHMAKVFVDLANQESQKLNEALEEALSRKN